VLGTRWFPYLVWLGTGLVWGTTWGVIRIGLRDLPPFTFAATRTLLAGLTLLVAAYIFDRARRPTGREWWFWILVGVPQLGLPYALVFWAEQRISSGLTAMLFATFPAFTAVLSHFALEGETLTVGTVGGVTLAILAAGILVGPSGQAPLMPSLAVLGASLSAAVGAVAVRRHGRRVSTLWLTAIQIAAGAAFLTFCAVLLDRGTEMRVTPRAILSVLYLAWVVTVGCYLGMFWLLKRLSATFVSMGVVLETSVAVVIGALALGEAVSLQLTLGLALVAVSVTLVARR
jgi:drug/metabolite transporter (DMT)-like permease